MSLTALTEVLETVRHGGAIAAFNVIQIEHAEAYAAAAEQSDLPVIMQISENCVRYHGSLEPIGAATLAIGRSCRVPVVVHLDHATDPELVAQALALGFTSVMFDGSALDDSTNCERTREVAKQCHAEGVSIEAELGEVGGKAGVHDPSARTDPSDAEWFVEATAVDALAVAVGSSHAMTERTAQIDTTLIERLRASVPVPLVLHGSSGVSDSDLVGAVAAGIRKVNIATHMNIVFTNAMLDHVRHQQAFDTRKYLGAAREAVASEAERLQRLLSGVPERP